MLTHDTVRELDPNGREVVGVKLANSAERAWIDAADYARMIDTIGPAAWFVGRNSQGFGYVRLKDPNTGRVDSVARIITGRVERSAVRYSDGNRFNLRQSNLELVFGCGGRPKRRRTSTQRAPHHATCAHA